MSKKVYVGIDLGTTNTLVSYVKGRCRLIAFDNARKVLPSVLYFDAKNGGNLVIGEKAVSQGDLDPNNKVTSSKTYMGSDKKYQFSTTDGKTIELTPTDVAAEILKEAKSKIVKKFKLEEEDEIYAVITTPAAFSFNQNEETRHAAEMAGLNVLTIIPEPTAAAISCMEDKKAGDKIFIVDIGGGTYDTAVLTMTEDHQFDMISAKGDRRLGGDNFDHAVFEYFKEQFQDESGINLDSQDESGLSYSEYNRLLSNLKNCAREAKEELTRSERVKVERNNLYMLDGEPQSYEAVLTRDEFNKICEGIYKKIEARLDESISAFKKQGMNISDITYLVLVGGTCYIPAVIELVERKFGIPSMQIADKTTAIAEGAAIVADNWTVLGASMGGIVAHSMGVKVKGNQFSKIIKSDTKYPCRQSEIYTTTRDYQKEVKIFIYAAAPDKEHISDISAHEYYGSFVLDNIESAPAGVPQIEVTFEFDSSQVLTVTAKDLKTQAVSTLIIDKSRIQQDDEGGSPMSMDLLIDVSGSMSGQKLIDAKTACKKMVNEIVDLSVHEIGITTFNNTQEIICPVTSDKEALLKSIPTMSAGWTTRMGDGIGFSTNKLLECKNAEKIIVLMTDGAPDSGDKSNIISEEIRRKHEIRLAVIYIGETSSRGYQYAQQVASANCLNSSEKPLFYQSDDMSDLGEIFKSVYADIKLAK